MRFPDNQQQFTAYWTGIVLQLPVGWALLYYLWTRDDLEYHSLMIWYVHKFESIACILNITN